MNAPPRHLVLWIPDWPVRAALGPQADDAPVAIVHGNTVLACSASARALGVRRGQRKRQAQSHSSALQMISADPARDERVFVPVLRLLEDLVPGIQPLRPGLAALRARGASRYYGGEEQASERLLSVLAEHGHPDARAGVADGLFTAEQAARFAQPTLVIPPGEAARFLSPLPVRILDDPDITALLDRLGVRTLADFAALAESDVRARFGERGVRLRSLAGGADSRPLEPQKPDPELARAVEFDTPLLQSDQIAFAVRQTADAVIGILAVGSLVCTEVRIEMTDDDGAVTDRVWMHPTSFDAGDLVDRVRWQLESFQPLTVEEGVTPAGIVRVRIVPTRVDDSAHHQPGLFGQGPEQRMHHAVSRVQALLGHRGVVTPVISGGRRLSDRQSFQPWGDKLVPERNPDQPWPGALPPPYPSEVFSPPVPVRLTAADESVPRVDSRGTLSSSPFSIEGSPIRSWAGPWTLREHSWDANHARLAYRFQIVDSAQRAWLVLCEDDAWWAEGRYR